MKAFSTIELLFVLLILGIMLSITLSFSKELLEKNRAEASANKLLTALSFARISAIKLGEVVTFCGSKDHKSCDGFWHEGQIIITSSNKIIRTWPKIFVGDKLVYRNSFNKNKIDFLPTGFPNGLKGSFHYYPRNNKNNALVITIESTGRARISKEEA